MSRMKSGRDTRVWLLLAVLGVCIHLSQSSCPPSPVPSFGQLLFNNTDVTQRQTNFDQNDVVEYRCAEGYELYNISTNTSLTQSTTMCQADGVWSLLGVSCTLSMTTPSVPSLHDIIIIVGAVLGATVLLLVLLNMCCCCWAFKLRTRIIHGGRDNEVGFVRSQGAFTLSNPLMIVKDDDSAGNPLFLTPEEMTALEGKH